MLARKIFTFSQLGVGGLGLNCPVRGASRLCLRGCWMAARRMVEGSYDLRSSTDRYTMRKV